MLRFGHVFGWFWPYNGIINKIIKRLRDYCKTSSKTSFLDSKYDIIMPDKEFLDTVKLKLNSKPGKGVRVLSEQIDISSLEL